MRVLPAGPDHALPRGCSRAIHPTESDIDGATSGNICRSGTYLRIREAIKQAAQSNGRG
jgi:aerobic-type carbon monoxide dehydrogenase small subunit (CoxS/CutS family)